MTLILQTFGIANTLRFRSFVAPFLLRVFKMAGLSDTEKQMSKLQNNANEADRLITELNSMVGNIESKMSRNISNVTANVTSLSEIEQLQAEILKWQEKLTILQIRNGKPYFPVPKLPPPSTASPAVLLAPTERGDGTLAPTKSEDLQVQPTDNKKNAAETQTKKNPKKDGGAKAKGQGQPPVEDVVDVGRLDFRVGKIVEVDHHPDADSLYVEKVDVGEPEPRTVVSGLVKHVPLDEMRNRIVVLLCNLKPAKMRGVTSEAMVMCASSPDKVEILVPPNGAVPGDIVEFSGITRNADQPFLNPKKKIFETLAPDLKTNDDKVATYKGIPFEINGKGVVIAPSLANVNVK